MPAMSDTRFRNLLAKGVIWVRLGCGVAIILRRFAGFCDSQIY